MTDLVKGLREYAGFDPDKALMHSQAADEIEMQEALLREIDRELDDVEYLGSYVDGIKALKAEIEQLKSQLKEK